MPIYEYECSRCGHRFELRRGVDESDSDIKCPVCGNKHPRRVLSSFATGSSSESCAPARRT
jgi:putative FmdB family regulatory protein